VVALEKKTLHRMRLSIPLTPNEYTVLKGNSVFFLPRCISGVKRDLPEIVEKAANFMSFHEGQHSTYVVGEFT
jgi:hypothetical protein